MKLEIRNLSCGYEPGRPLVRGLDMDLSGGEICCVLGPNGVGKTTLLKTLLGLLPPLAGQIALDGEDTRRWTRRRRARVMACVAQAHNPAFPYRVEEVALMGRMGLMGVTDRPAQADFEIAWQALEQVGISHLADRPYTDLSGGERQLLMIARALAQQPRLLLMDEPTANLDYGNTVRIIQCVRTLARQGVCVLLTTHAPEHAFWCGGRAVLLDREGTARFGPAETVVTERNLYAAYDAKIQILSVITSQGETLRVAAPRFSTQQQEENVWNRL